MRQVDPFADLPPRLSRSWTSLPRLVADTVLLVKRAAPREFLLTVLLRVASGLAAGALLLLGARALQRVVTTGTDTPQLSHMLAPMLLLALTTMGVGVLTSYSQELQYVLGALVARDTQQRLLAVTASVELQAYDSPEFHDRLDRAALGSHVRPMALVNALLVVIAALSGLIAISGALLLLRPWLLPVVLLAAAPLMCAAAYAGKVRLRFSLKMTPTDREREYVFGLLTSRNAAAEVRAFNAGGFLRLRHARLYDEHLAELRAASARRLRITLRGATASAGVIGVTIGLLLWLAATGRMSLAEVGVALGAVVLIVQRLALLVSATGQLYESARFVEDMWLFLSPPATAPAIAREVPARFDVLRVEDVSFSYPGSQRSALHQVSMEIRAGEVVALVGENGSGKTTLARLLARLYLPTRGHILWDGRDTSIFDSDELRRGIAVVFQDYLRYALSVAENIGLGDASRAHDDEAVRDAAKRAGVHGIVETLPAGYRTLLAPEWEGGSDLSLGQWQRVALARAFFRDAPFVVLDEPTAALDARAEHELLKHVRGLFADRSVLLISHRLSSVRHADRIYVLEQGRIIEHGTHHELMRRAGRYAELFGLQASAYVPSEEVLA